MNATHKARAEAAERKYNSVIEEMKESNKLLEELQRENRELKAGVFADEMGKKARELLIDRDAMRPVVDAAVEYGKFCVIEGDVVHIVRDGPARKARLRLAQAARAYLDRRLKKSSDG